MMASEGSTTNNAKRQQGVSCDACRFRKVKCDRRTKIEQRRADEDESQIACSICSGHGLRCTFTQSAPRKRRGKRIVAIQQSQLDDVDDDLAQRSLEAENSERLERMKQYGAKPTNAVGFGLPESIDNSIFGTDAQLSVDGPASNAGLLAERIRARNRSGSLSKTDADKQLKQQGLFGVQGLTRALLDACVRAYFKYASPCMPILHVEVFSARYSLFFAIFEARAGNIPSPNDSPESTDDQPLSLLLILAVGCVGAAFLEPTIATPGSTAKFRLQDRMALRFAEVLKEKDTVTRLNEEGADVLEACYIMSDASLTILGDDQKDKEIDLDRMLQAPLANRSLLDPLKMSPSTSEAVVKLIFTMGMNRRPQPRKECPVGDARKWLCGGIPITDREVFRRVRIFWSVFMQDSFRSMGTRKNVLIGDDDYDIDLPRFIPQKNGIYSAMLFYPDPSFYDGTDDFSADSVMGVQSSHGPLRSAKFGRFDAMQLEVMLRLAFIVRTVSIRFVSPRAQGRGVLITDVERATTSLSAWYSLLPKDVQWETQVEPLLRSFKQGKRGSNNAIALRNSIKSIFVECLYHGNVLGTWASVNDYGIRFELDIAETAHLFANRMGLDGNVALRATKDVGGTGAGSGLEQENVEERKKRARAGMDALAGRSLRRIAKVAREAGLVGILRANRSVLLNICSSYAVWGCDLGRRIAQTGDNFGIDVGPGQDAAALVFSCVDDILFAMSTVDTFEPAPGLVKQITGLLRKSRASVAYDSSPETSKSPTNVYDKLYGEVGLDDPSPGGISVTSDDSSSSGAGEQPFHYFFRKGNKLDLGDSVRDIGRQPGKTSSSGPSPQFVSADTSVSPSSMEVDAVMQLARAALPNQKAGKDNMPPPTFASSIRGAAQGQDQTARNNLYSGLPPSGGGGGGGAVTTSSSQQQNYPTTEALYGPALDLNLAAITGVDSQWLMDYLGSNETAQNAQFSSRLSPTTQAGAAPSQYIQHPAGIDAFAQAANAPPPFNVSNVTPTSANTKFTIPEWSIGADSGKPINVEQASTQAIGVDLQWDQLMANAGDAQLWAESQWQGFTFA